MSMTSALISVESAIAMSFIIRAGVCAAQRSTYRARTIDVSARRAVSLAPGPRVPVWLGAALAAPLGISAVASCDARALAFGSQARAASEAKRMLRMWGGVGIRRVVSQCKRSTSESVSFRGVRRPSLYLRSMQRFVPLLVLVLVGCRTERVEPPRAEFLIAAGDSSFWVRSQNGRLKIRGAPLQLARLRGRFHEIYVADDDRSHYEALIVGQRVFRRDLHTGDSVAIFADTTAASIERWYRDEHPNDPRVSAEEDVSEHPIVEATAEIGLLDAFGPYQSYEYHSDGVIQGGAE